jgi:hypothetical protein
MIVIPLKIHIIMTINEIKIVKCQSFFRGWLARKKNIYGLIKKFKGLKSTFDAVINGYHMINKAPIKESVWEEINCDIVKNICHITDEANGNHLSGKDNRFDNINYSNKSTKTDGNNISISSYRLTSVCNDSNTGDSEEILKEIKKRDKSFDYYSILVRNEKQNIIEYMWYVIPKDFHIFNTKKFTPKLGKIGKKKNKIVGWESEYCDITFSMSSQLWYKFNIKNINKFKICSTKIDNSKPKINYSQIFESFCNCI